MAKKTVSELWEDIFIDFDVLNVINSKGFIKISADEIRPYKEPRLMTKFDYSKQLPKVFKENKLGILPTKNGEYIIGKYNLFQNISNTKYDEIEPQKMTMPNYIETIDPDNIYSESNALNVALLSGMIKETVGEDVVETIQGKMRATGFNFEIDGENGKQIIEVDKPAMEIDGGYEGENNVCLIEAKNYLPDDFIIRQLYYPYRHWIEKVNKKIIPIFFGYDNGIYNFFVYEFENYNDYNSLQLKEIKRFVISSRNSDEIKRKIFESVELIDDKSQNIIPFPQANSFTKIIGILDMIEHEINAQDIADFYEFDLRQGSYYLSAAKYLGIVDGNNAKYQLTSDGFIIANLDTKSRNEEIIKMILRHKVFYYSYKYYLENDVIPDRDFIIELMKKYTDIPKETPNGEENGVLARRASTVRGWIQWIIGCQV